MDTYQAVTDKIVAALETAQAWRKPWTSAFGGSTGGTLARPINAISRKPYHGTNTLLLWAANRSSPCWATYKAWQSIGAQVRKGERGTLATFWKQIETKAEETEGEESGDDSDARKRLICRPLFNAEQVDGWKGATVAPSVPGFDPIANAETFVANTGAIIRHGGDRAYYSLGSDAIQMPERAAFVGTKTSSPAEAYYGTLLHELTHWTGSAARCGREFGRRFGDNAYAFEELVAELGAAFLCADLSIAAEPRPDHASYVANWLSVLRNDKRAVFTAASKAEQAARFVTDLQPKAVAAIAA